MTTVESSDVPVDVAADPGNREMPTNRKPPARVDSLGIIFAALAILSAGLSVLNGILPIYAIIAIIWGALAWYSIYKPVTSRIAIAVIVLCAVLCSGLEGFALGQRFGRDSYSYLSQKNAQYRVNQRSGRTDRLTDRGWRPVSFDSKAEEIPNADLSFAIRMKHGEWNNLSPFSTRKICFDVQNDSDFVIADIGINAFVRSKGGDSSDKKNLLQGDNSVRLTSSTGYLLDIGEQAQFCGPAPRDLSSDETWDYSPQPLRGWKK